MLCFFWMSESDAHHDGDHCTRLRSPDRSVQETRRLNLAYIRWNFSETEILFFCAALKCPGVAVTRPESSFLQILPLALRHIKFNLQLGSSQDYRICRVEKTRTSPRGRRCV